MNLLYRSVHFLILVTLSLEYLRFSRLGRRQEDILSL